MTYKEEKINLYNRAKEAYYNGEEIMTDIEFDQLEKELGLENKSHVGARHNPSYTVRHPFVMGSLSKVQIHEKDGKVDWAQYLQEARKYFGTNPVIMTPKYDGCSFEIYVNNVSNVITISTRGDGFYGRDIYDHIIGKVPNSLLSMHYPQYVLRGEVLIKKSVFEKKYSEQFTNPRSFVSGVLNSDYSDSDDFLEKMNDLDIVVYDFRTADNDGNWVDHDWTELVNVEQEILPARYWTPVLDTDTTFAWYYNDFAEFRKHSEYALDGFVIKPKSTFRKMNLNDARPKDCVAIKFIPMLEETEVVNITWNLGKTGEYTPIIWVNPVEMDGRMVQKCSGHNYGLLVQQGVGIGSKIIMSLAGDIIPFLYKVTETHIPLNIPMPENYTIDGVHMMAVLSEKDVAKNKFINSAASLNIPNIGPATAEQIFEYMTKTNGETDTFFGDDVETKIPTNILMLSSDDIYFGSGAGKTGENAKKSFKQYFDNMSLVDIIKSCNFKFCGAKVAQQVANYLMGLEYDFTHLATEGYSWCMDKNSNEYNELNEILSTIGKTFDDYKPRAVEVAENATTQIPVILTGEPNNYKSKGEFLKCHPEYRMTGSWKEVQIVFTNDMDSNTGKMKKAREKGIEIRVY